MSPFYKRTEFYLSVAALAFGALLGAGVLVPDSVGAKIVGMLVEALAVLGYTYGRTVAKSSLADLVPLKPGYKSSEFWQVLVAQGLLAVQALQIVPQGSTFEGMIAALLTALPTVGYSASRGKVKANACVLLALLVPLALSLESCASWKQQSLSAVTKTHQVLVAAQSKNTNDLNGECTQRAESCRDSRRLAESNYQACKTSLDGNPCRDTAMKAAVQARACSPLASCLAAKKAINTGFIGAQLLLADAIAGIDLGEAAFAGQLATILAKVQKAITSAQVTLSEMRSR